MGPRLTLTPRIKPTTALSKRIETLPTNVAVRGEIALTVMKSFRMRDDVGCAATHQRHLLVFIERRGWSSRVGNLEVQCLDLQELIDTVMGTFPSKSRFLHSTEGRDRH